MSTLACLDFRSDNVGTVHEKLLQALARENNCAESPYGADETTQRLNERYSELFEAKVVVFPVSTGTAANALSLASCARPYGAIYCAGGAHINMSEGGATEAFSGGAKIVALPGTDNKIHAQHLATALETAGRGIRNRSQPDAVSITQARENGTVYSVAEVAEIGRIARNEKILFHMDGARFANAVAHLQSNIADLTWRAGVDILSFGVTKNGGMNVEAIVVFNESLAETLSYRLRRSGHTWSKMRFSAAQLIAYVEDNLFLQLAATANAHAKRIEIGICDIPGVRVISAVQANLVFVEMSPQAISRLADQRVRFSRRTDTEIRLVTRYDNTLEEVDELIHRVALATAND